VSEVDRETEQATRNDNDVEMRDRGEEEKPKKREEKAVFSREEERSALISESPSLCE